MTAMAVDVDQLWLSLRTTGAEGVCRLAHAARWDDAEPGPCGDCTSITGDVITALLDSPRFRIGWADDSEPLTVRPSGLSSVPPTSDARRPPPTPAQSPPHPEKRSSANRPRKYASAKVKAARREWGAIIAQSEYVPSLRARVPLGKATRQQVLEMSRYRAAHARNSAAMAECLETIADAMKSLDARTVEDLPADLIVRTFNSGSDE